MKYAVITVTDGNFIIRSEWSNMEGAIKDFHRIAGLLWNDGSSFSKGYIAVVDSNLDILNGGNGGYKEFIVHPQQEELIEEGE